MIKRSAEEQLSSKTQHKDSTRCNIEAKHLIKRAITGVLIWNFHIPRYNRKAMQTERNNQNGKR